MTIQDSFRHVLDTIDNMFGRQRRGWTVNDTDLELRKIRLGVSDLAKLFEEYDYYEVEITHKDVPEQLRYTELLLADWQVDLLRAAQRKPSYEYDRIERSVVTLFVYQVQEMLSGLMRTAPQLTSRHVRLKPQAE